MTPYLLLKTYDAAWTLAGWAVLGFGKADAAPTRLVGWRTRCAIALSN